MTSMKSQMNGLIAGILMAAALLACGNVSAVEMTTGPATIKQLVNSSDTVVIGKCLGKSSAMVGKHIETTYEFSVEESLKGSRGAGSKISLTVPGGELSTFPLGEFVPEQAHMYKGEETALFLKEVPPGTVRKSMVPSNSKLPDSPKVVGGWQGKYTVYSDATTGKKSLVRFNLENYGYAHNDDVMQKFIKAYSEGKMNDETMSKMTMKPIKTQSGDSNMTLVQPPLKDVLPSVIGIDDFKAQVKAAK